MTSGTANHLYAHLPRRGWAWIADGRAVVTSAPGAAGVAGLGGAAVEAVHGTHLDQFTDDDRPNQALRLHHPMVPRASARSLR